MNNVGIIYIMIHLLRLKGLTLDFLLVKGKGDVVALVSSFVLSVHNDLFIDKQRGHQLCCIKVAGD